MARVHKWYFLVNQAGEPIEAAQIWINLAGSGAKDAGVPAWIYYDETTNAGTRTSPQLTTLENGYFEFWIDEEEDFDLCGIVPDFDSTKAYGFNQKFRLDWDKTNVHTGFVDWVDVFPPNRFFQKVDEYDCVGDEKNKVVSNALACFWNNHASDEFPNINDPFNPPHGLLVLDTDVPNDEINKILTNNMGWTWDSHELTNVWDYSERSGIGPSGSRLGGLDPEKSPHGLEPLVIGSTDTDFNKVVSDDLMTTIRTELDEISFGVFDILNTGGDAQWESIDADGHYEAPLFHNLDIMYPNVTCYDTTTGMMVKQAEVEYIDEDNIKIHIGQTRFNMKVRVSV